MNKQENITMVEEKFMSEENNFYENNNEEARYTHTSEPNPTDNYTYAGEPVNYSSGKGQGQGFGIASMVCGIISLIGCCGLYYVSIPCAIAAIVLGIVQIVKNESKGMAIAGIICGAIGLIISIIIVIAAIVFVSSGAYNEFYQEIMNELGTY